MVSGRLGKVHIPAAYYEIRTADGRVYVLEPGAPDVDSSLRQALGGTLAATGYVNPASPYKIRGTALRTVKLAGVVLASDAPPASASPAPPAMRRKRKSRPTVTAHDANVNILDLEDTGVRRRRRKPVRTPPPTVQNSAYRSDEEDRPARPRYRRKKKAVARPPQPKAQQPQDQPKGAQPKAGAYPAPPRQVSSHR